MTSKYKYQKAAEAYDRELKKQRCRRRLLLAATLFAVFAVVAFFVLARFGVWAKLAEKFGGSSLSDYPVSVSFIDVGQGDSILIAAGESAVLVDTGDGASDYAIFEEISKAGVGSLDCLILTHPHADHIGGARSLLENIEVKRILTVSVPDELVPTNYTYTSLMQTVEGKGIPISTVGAGDSIELDCGYIEVLSPFDGIDYDDLNNYSLVLRYVYGKTAFLFTGDAELEAEDEILYTGYTIACSVLKVGHHGSRYSSSQEFLNAANAQYAVISCSADNSYGYPHVEVLERLRKTGSVALCTAQLGTVRFGCDGEKVYLIE